MEIIRKYFRRFFKEPEKDVVFQLLNFETFTKYDNGPYKYYIETGFTEYFASEFLNVALLRRFNLAFYRHNTFIVCHQDYQAKHCVDILIKTNVNYQWLKNTDSIDGEYGMTIYVCDLDWIRNYTFAFDGSLVHRGIRFNTYRIVYFEKDFVIEGLDAKYTYYMI
jgi:hypothetical protein